jgi:RNA polymerase sigma factor (sigma-70 family)
MEGSAPLVFIVDDDPSVGNAVGRLFRAAGFQVEAFLSAEQFLRFPRPDAPACAVMDIEMPGVDGLELQERLAAARIAMPVVFITGRGDVPRAVRAMKAGAVDFLTKPFQDHELLAAVEKALYHESEARQRREEQQRIGDRAATLTVREREVFALVTEGLLNKQVATRLGTSEKTIKAHRARVMEKMHADSLPALVRMAEAVGLHHRVA